MDRSRLLGSAVANNAAWCDAVCRSHGHPGTFGSRLWVSPRHRLRLYPHAITLRPDITVPEVLASATPGPFSVKDSFGRLDLTSKGFGLLAEARWIVRDSAPDGQPDDSPPWEKATSPAELAAWETAWSGGSGDGPVFRPDLLADPRCAVLACRRDGVVAAGAIVYASDGATGISNVFSAALSPDRLWAGVQRAAADLWPQQPLVGYEQGADLEAARLAGFRVLAPLRIWGRPPQ